MRALLIALALVAPVGARAEAPQPQPQAQPQPPPEVVDAVPAASGPIGRPLVLAPGACEAHLVVESNLTIRAAGEPISIAPDLRCGVGGRLAVGVVHSARALSEVDSGQGICLSGEDGGCRRPYDGAALELLGDLTGPGRSAAAARVRLVARSLEPFKPSLRLGLLARLGGRRTALLIDPHVSLGLDNEALGNRDQVALPVWGQLQLGRRVLLHLHTGARGELEGLGEKLEVPVGLGVLVELAPAWDVALEAGFPQLLGPQNTFKLRHGALTLTYRRSPRRSSGTPPPSAGWYTAR